MENNNDFEEMRQQMGLLKNKLDNQNIVNKDIIRHVVQKKMNTVNRVGWGVVILGLLEVPLVLWIFRVLCGLSWAFCIVTALYFLATAVFQVWLNLSVQRQIRPDSDLIAVGQQLADVKRRNVKRLCVTMPFQIMWTAYFLWEVYQNQGIGPLSFQTIFYIVIFGVVLGLAVGISVFIKRYVDRKDPVSQTEVFLPQTSQLWNSRVTDAINAIQESGK